MKETDNRAAPVVGRQELSLEIGVRFGAKVRPGLPARVTITLPAGSTVADLVARLEEAHPEIGSALDSALAVVGGKQASATQQLLKGDSVAFVLPVAGG